MALKIIHPWEAEPVTQIVTVIYGKPGFGKTTLAFTANDPLLLDFDGGGQRAGNTKDRVAVSRWGDVDSMTETDLEPYRTIVVDTLGMAQQVMTADIIARNPKHGKSGALTLQGYGELKGRFTQWLKYLKSIGKDVVLIAHATEEQHGEDVVDRVKMIGGAKDEVYADADAIGKVVVNEHGRTLTFDPSEASYGKNPAQLAVANVPGLDAIDGFLGTVIESIKDAMSQLDEAAAELRGKAIAEHARQVDAFKTRVQDTNGDAEAMTAVRADIIKSDLPRDTKMELASLLSDQAQSHGMLFDKEAESYRADPTITPQPAATPTPTPEPVSEPDSPAPAPASDDEEPDYDARIAELTEQVKAAAKAKDKPRWLALQKERSLVMDEQDKAQAEAMAQ